MSYIAIGKVTQPHGLQGYVKVVSYARIPERFLELKTVYIDTETGLQGLIIEEVVIGDRITMLKFRGVDSREAARFLAQAELWVPDEQSIALSEGTYFIHDLVGLNVFDTEETFLGNLSEVWQGAGNDIYVITRGKREVLIPAVSDFILNIDLNEKKMTVQLIEGMIE